MGKQYASLPVEDLHKLFRCDYDSGILYWKTPTGPRVKEGQPVRLRYNQNGYVCIETCALGKRREFRLHRVIWAMYHNSDPGHQDLDHIDGNKCNNSIHNLRIATPTQNQHNRKRRGFKRANHLKNQPCWRGGWEVRIGNSGFQQHLGTFPCPLIARVVYESAKRFIAKDFSPV